MTTVTAMAENDVLAAVTKAAQQVSANGGHCLACGSQRLIAEWEA